MKAFQWVCGILIAGIGTWIVSMFPNLAAATFGSLVTYYVAKEHQKLTFPTPSFWVAWIAGVITAAIVSYLDSMVPVIGYLTSAFLGGVVMFVATLFREKVQVHDDGHATVVVTPPVSVHPAIEGPKFGVVVMPPPERVRAS